MASSTRARKHERAFFGPPGPGTWLFIGLLAAIAGFAGMIFALPMLTVGGLLVSLVATTSLSTCCRKAINPIATDRLDELAHELRGPIVTIRGYADSFDGDDPTHNDACIEAIQRNAAFVGRLIDSAFGSIPVTPSHATFDLHRLIEDVSSAAQRAAEAKNIGFCVDLASNVPEHAAFDGDRWRQVVSNLLENAVKFTTHGTVSLCVDVDGGLLMASVCDTGCGIAKADIPSVFRPFARLEPSSTTGKGLGLHVAERLARDLGGVIRVDSAPGKGSVFAFSCPIHADLDRGGDCDGWHLLVVDDCPFQRRLLSRQLRKACAEPLEAASGEEAIEIVRSSRVDAVILDLQLDGLDGFETSQTLRDEGFDGVILGVSAHVTDPRAAQARSVGIDFLLQKPISTRDLLAHIAATPPLHARAREAG